MNPYQALAQEIGGTEVREFVRELGQWHDEMVLHQRQVRRLGAREACSEDCPHVAGRRLWLEATRLLGSRAADLAFLRSCASPQDDPAAARSVTDAASTGRPRAQA